MSRGQRFVTAATLHVDTVLAHASDRWGRYQTPLIADGLEIATRKPVRWRQKGQVWVISNAASQQNFVRTMYGLTRLTGNTRYTDRAQEMVGYLMHHVRQGDLLWWGGHCAVDLSTKALVHCVDGLSKPYHELKGVFPFYDAMFDVDQAQARRIVEAQWICHVADWSNLTVSRHNLGTIPPWQPGRQRAPKIWDAEYRGGDVDTGYLGFMPSSFDLVYAATALSARTGDARPATWACRLTERHTSPPGTDGSGLPAYLLSSSTNIFHGTARPDRAREQFGALLGPGGGEHTVWTAAQIRQAMYCLIALQQMGQQEPKLAALGAGALRAFIRHSFDPDDGRFHPVLTDGTRLTEIPLRSSGYFGAQGTTLAAVDASQPALLALARTLRGMHDDTLWQACRVLMRSNQLGDLGEPDGSGLDLSTAGRTSEPLYLLAMLALYEATGRPDFLVAAERIGDNMLKSRLINGLFSPPGRTYAKIDALEALAALHLAAALDRPQVQIPAWPGGRGRFHAHFDGASRTTDSEVFYSATATGKGHHVNGSLRA